MLLVGTMNRGRRMVELALRKAKADGIQLQNSAEALPKRIQKQSLKVRESMEDPTSKVRRWLKFDDLIPATSGSVVLTKSPRSSSTGRAAAFCNPISTELDSNRAKEVSGVLGQDRRARISTMSGIGTEAQSDRAITVPGDVVESTGGTVITVPAAEIEETIFSSDPVPSDIDTRANKDSTMFFNGPVAQTNLVLNIDPVVRGNVDTSTEPIYAASPAKKTTSSDPNTRKRKQTRHLMSPKSRKRAKDSQRALAHGVRAPCAHTCKRKCSTIISEDQRKKLNADFWKLTWYERRVLIVAGVKSHAVGRRSTGGKSKRNVSFMYSLKNESSESVSVCKVFYLGTLGFAKNNDTVVQKALHAVSPGKLAPKKDGRGKGVHKAIDRHKIHTHVESFGPAVSHYRREHAPNRRYLPSDITINCMHKDFLSKNPGVLCSYEIYRAEIARMQISFTKLGHEECEICESFSNHSEHHTKENLDLLCEACCKWQSHISKAEESRRNYRIDRDMQESPSGEETNRVVYSADLQKVIMLPRLETLKTVLFTRRIIAFNESFVPLGNKPAAKPMAVLWHEGLSGRKKEDIVSAFHAFFISQRDAKVIVLWLDNCAGQNKNWTLFSYLVYIINSDEIAADEVHLKFFEPGHTFMSADNFHHQVELSLKKAGKVYDFNDFLQCVQNANSGRVIVKEMAVSDYFDWPDVASQYKLTRTVPRPYLSEMVWVKAVRGSQNLLYRNAFSKEDKDLNFLTAAALKGGLKKPECRVESRGIPRAKKDDILAKLGCYMPPNRLKFWHEIKVADVADLTVSE